MPEKSTTPDLVEVVTDLVAAVDRGDWDAVVGPLAPDVIWETESGIIDTAGASRVRGFLEEWAGMFEDYTVKLDTVLDLGNGVVYSVLHQEGHPPGSASVVTFRAALIYEWVDGRIVRFIGHLDIDEGRALAERLAASRG
jgi:ketosteroid isomerase-like protein